jgi:photosystem II stability/assembly factor-like uncharacterized protein
MATSGLFHKFLGMGLPLIGLAPIAAKHQSPSPGRPIPAATESTYSLTPAEGLGADALELYSFYGPVGYPENLIVGNPYFLAHNGILRDNGESWLDLLMPFPGYVQAGIEDRNDPRHLYLSYDPGPFLKSVDGGQTWRAISAPFAGNRIGWYIAQDASGTLYLIAGASLNDFHLYVSSDKGETWSEVLVKKGAGRLKEGGFLSFWADPAVPKLLYAFDNRSDDNAFLVSKDGGKNFVRREKGMPHRADGRLPRYGFSSFAQSSVPPYTIYAPRQDLANEAMYYSHDSGKKWHPIRPVTGIGQVQFGTLRVKPGTDDVLWAAGYIPAPDRWRFMESLDGGKTWSPKGTLLPSEGWTEDQLCGWFCPYEVPGNTISTDHTFNLAVLKNGNIVLSKQTQGFLLSKDGGETFEVHSGGAHTRSFASVVAASDGTLYAGQAWASGSTGLWSSTDSGQSWSHRAMLPTNSLAPGPDGAIYGSDGAVFKDGGVTFLTNQPKLMNTALVVSMEGSVVFCGYDAWQDFTMKCYRSMDGGGTWHPLGTLGSEINHAKTALLNPNDTEDIIVGGWNGDAGCGPFDSPFDSPAGAIYRSQDGGASWVPVLNTSVLGGVTGLYRSKANPDILVASAMGRAEPGTGALGGVFISQDGGATWERRSEGLPSFLAPNAYGEAPMISAVVSPPQGLTLFCAVQLNGGFFRSDDLGSTWHKIADLPIRIPDEYISNYLCHITIQRTAVTQILPLNDCDDSFLAATMGQGIFKGSPTGVSSFMNKTAPPGELGTGANGSLPAWGP